MKIRTDFVTNSSSSSFILAKKGELNAKQKEALLEYIEKNFIGKSAISSEEQLKEYAKEYWINEEGTTYAKMSAVLRQGMDVYRGNVDFEMGDIDLAEIYEDIWKILEQNSDGNFIIIDGDLSY